MVESSDDDDAVVRNSTKHRVQRRVVGSDSETDDDGSFGDISRAHRNITRGRNNRIVDSSSDDEDDDDDESDIEFTTEDVKEEEEEEEEEEFEDALDTSFSEVRNGAFEEETLRRTEAYSSSDDDDDEFADMTPILETVVKRPMTIAKEQSRTSSSSVVLGEEKAPAISLFQAFRSPEAKRAFATTPTTVKSVVTPHSLPLTACTPAGDNESINESITFPSRSPPSPPQRSAPSPTVNTSPAPAPSLATNNKPNMRLKGKTFEDKQFSLDHSVAVKLYDHQRDAIRWLWDLQLRNKGGILADDMGLGKTMSSAAFIAGSLKSKTIKRALILAPTTLLPHWKKELIVCGLNEKKEIFSYIGTKEQRAKVLKKVQSRAGEGSVLLCTYGMLSHNPEEFGVVVENDEETNYRQIEEIECSEGRGFEVSSKNYRGNCVRFGWVVMDEGHQMKNPNTKIARYVRRLPCDLRLVVSGTPIQNHLGELWALYDLAAPGLLGSEDQFRKNFARKITSGRSRDASESERHEARELSKMLRKMCAPYFLRREKEGILRDGDKDKDGGEKNKEKNKEATVATTWASTRNAPKKMGKKNDLVAWIPLSKAQKTLYEAFLQSPMIQRVLNKNGSALSALSALKKICDDPYLAFRELENATSDELQREDGGDEDVDNARSMNSTDALREVASSIGLDVDQLRENPLLFSAKLKRLHVLLSEFKRNGKKVLVFSQSRYALDRCEGIAKKIFDDENQVTRIDGNVSANMRHDRVTEFQKSDSPNMCMLLTTRVGGLGITLTAATRVIIFDPSWNPTTDNQSVDRAYRIGQTENVVIYRMITIGTVEEKTYRKQVFKQGIANDAQKGGGNEDFSPSEENNNEDEFRYFSSAETDGNIMFTFDAANSDVSSTAKTLNSLHAQHREYDEQLKRELESTKGFFEVSDHDLLFSQADSTQAGSGAGKVPDSKLGGGKKKGSSKSSSGDGGGVGILGKGNAKNANWGGAGLLSSLAAKADAVAVNIKRRGSDTGGGGQDKSDGKSNAILHLQKLQKEEKRTSELLSNQTLLSKLPDNGERAHAKKQDLEKQIEQLRLSIESL